MKKVITLIFALMWLISLSAQDAVGNRVIAKRSFFLNDWWIDAIQRDTVNMSSTTSKLPTSKAVFDLVKGRFDQNVHLTTNQTIYNNKTFSDTIKISSILSSNDSSNKVPTSQWIKDRLIQYLKIGDSSQYVTYYNLTNSLENITGVVKSITANGAILKTGTVSYPILDIDTSTNEYGLTTLYKNTKNIKYVDTTSIFSGFFSAWSGYSSSIYIDAVSIQYNATGVNATTVKSLFPTPISLGMTLNSSTLSQRITTTVRGFDTVKFTIGISETKPDYYIDLSPAMYKYTAAFLKDIYLGTTTDLTPNIINQTIYRYYFSADIGIPGTYGNRFQVILVQNPLVSTPFFTNNNLNLKGPLRANDSTGLPGQVLMSLGSNNPPSWQTISGGGSSDWASITSKPTTIAGYSISDAVSTSTLSSTLSSYQTLLTNPVTGMGTSGFVPIRTGPTTIGNSIIQESGGKIGIGGVPTYPLTVVGNSDIFAKGPLALVANNLSNIGVGLNLDAVLAGGRNYSFISGGSGSYLPGGWAIYDVTTSAYRLSVSAAGNFTVGPMASSSDMSASRIGSNGNISVGNTYYKIAAPTDGMIVEGNAGIGVSSPTEKLHVVGNVLATSFKKAGGTSSQLLQADGSVLTKPTTVAGWASLGASGFETMLFTNGYGFSATISNPTTMPTMVLNTTVTGLLKGDAGAMVAAVAGTDYTIPSSVTPKIVPLATLSTDAVNLTQLADSSKKSVFQKGFGIGITSVTTSGVTTATVYRDTTQKSFSEKADSSAIVRESKVSFTQQVSTNALATPVASTTYYFGASPHNGGMVTGSTQKGIVLPFACRLVGYSLAGRSSIASVPASAITLSIVNITTSTTSSLNTTFVFTGVGTNTNYANNLNITFAAGDQFQLKLDTPAWTTVPTNIEPYVVLYFQNL